MNGCGDTRKQLPSQKFGCHIFYSWSHIISVDISLEQTGIEVENQVPNPSMNQRSDLEINSC